MLYDEYRNGINFGGWLSQFNYYVSNNQERSQWIKKYIQESDFAWVAKAGFDHVRIPIDYTLLENKEVYPYLEKSVEYAKKYHLNLIFDLHEAYGNQCQQGSSVLTLLQDEEAKQRFIAIWVSLTKHFKEVKEPQIMFELFNEVVDSTGYLWNQLYKETIQEIRKIDQERYLLVGSNLQNSVFTLKELDLVEDPYVFYNFHFYEPIAFTHQNASFSEEMATYGKPVHYPGNMEGILNHIQNYPEYKDKYAYIQDENNYEQLKKYFNGAIDFVKYSGKQLYCGEYGIIDQVEDDDAIRWMGDCKKIMDEYLIGHALWNYKGLHFGIYDKNGKMVSKKQ